MMWIFNRNIYGPIRHESLQNSKMQRNASTERVEHPEVGGFPLYPLWTTNCYQFIMKTLGVWSKMRRERKFFFLK